MKIRNSSGVHQGSIFTLHLFTRISALIIFVCNYCKWTTLKYASKVSSDTTVYFRENSKEMVYYLQINTSVKSKFLFSVLFKQRSWYKPFENLLHWSRLILVLNHEWIRPHSLFVVFNENADRSIQKCCHSKAVCSRISSDFFAQQNHSECSPK